MDRTNTPANQEPGNTSGANNSQQTPFRKRPQPATPDASWRPPATPRASQPYPANQTSAPFDFPRLPDRPNTTSAPQPLDALPALPTLPDVLGSNAPSTRTTRTGAQPAISSATTGQQLRQPMRNPSSTASRPIAASGSTGVVPALAGLSSRETLANETGRLAAIRTRTPTAQLSAIQPPDVVRTAMSELGLLARELAILPDQLEESGLAPSHQRTYLEAVHAYLGLARQAWEAIAEERFEQNAADPEYSQRAIVVTRRIAQLQQECRAALENDAFRLPARVPLRWRRRVALARAGLRVWQQRFSPTPNPLLLGRSLFLLRGYVGLASANPIALFLFDFLRVAFIALFSLASLGIVLLFIAALLQGQTTITIMYGIVAIAFGLVWVLAPRFDGLGAAPVALLLGANASSVTRTTRNVHPGSPFASTLLLTWWIAIAILAVPALLAAIALGGATIGLDIVLALPDALPAGMGYIGALLTLIATPPAALALLALLLIVAPALLATNLRFAAELSNGPIWSPTARRYALTPALSALMPLTCALIIGVWLLCNLLGLDRQPLATLTLDTGLRLVLTWRSVATLLIAPLPYLLLIETPFRLGMRRWRRTWLRDLDNRRTDVESHVRRLSVADPHSGSQNTSDENLRAMQYDLVLLQFYRDKLAEAKRTTTAPFTITAYIPAIVLLLLLATLLDTAAAFLVNIFPLLQ